MHKYRFFSKIAKVNVCFSHCHSIPCCLVDLWILSLALWPDLIRSCGWSNVCCRREHLTFSLCFFTTKLCPMSYKIEPDKLQNDDQRAKICAQCCVSTFLPGCSDLSIWWKQFILLLYFTFSHFLKSSLTLLQKIYLLVFHMPNKCGDVITPYIGCRG